MPEDEMTSAAPATPLASEPSIFVYLYTGLIEEIRPANAVRLTGDAVILFYAAQPVAQYSRRDVFFCSKTSMEPFPL